MFKAAGLKLKSREPQTDFKAQPPSLQKGRTLLRIELPPPHTLLPGSSTTESSIHLDPLGPEAILQGFWLDTSRCRAV